MAKSLDRLAGFFERDDVVEAGRDPASAGIDFGRVQQAIQLVCDGRAAEFRRFQPVADAQLLETRGIVGLGLKKGAGKGGAGKGDKSNFGWKRG